MQKGACSCTICEGMAESRALAQSQSPNNDLSTTTVMSTLDVIGQVYSEGVKRELSLLEFENKEFAFACKGYVSGANYSAKRGTFIFFINSAHPSLWVRTRLMMLLRSLGRMLRSQAQSGKLLFESPAQRWLSLLVCEPADPFKPGRRQCQSDQIRGTCASRLQVR